MDIAPVLVPPSRFSSSIASRINFIQANFLESWPFEDETFDFVRIAFVGAAVPEHLWQHIFDEATRVLGKKGWLQCIDEVSVISAPIPAAKLATNKVENHDVSARTALGEGNTSVIISDGESRTALQAKVTAFERALNSSKSILSLRLSFFATFI